MEATLKAEVHEIAVDRFHGYAARFFPLREKRSPWQWAMDERIVGRGVSPLTQNGPVPYRRNAWPWCEEPSNTAADESVEMTVLWLGSALGKTDGISGNIIGWGIAEKPTNIQSLFPIELQRDKFSRDIIQAGLIDATPSVNRAVVEKKSRDTGNTVSYKKFVGGSIYMLAGGSVNAYRGQRIGISHMGEVDAFDASIGVEGDPVLLAKMRTEGFHAAFIVEGTGRFAPEIRSEEGRTIKIYRSRIHYWYEQSDQRRWFCPCRKCGALQFLLFRQIRYPQGKPHLAVYCCAKCDASHTDPQRIEMVRAGKWFPTRPKAPQSAAADYEHGLINENASPLLSDLPPLAPFDGIAGFWLNGFNSLLPPARGSRTKIHQFIRDAERAEKGMDPEFSKRAWINTVCTGLNSPESQGEAPPSWKDIYDRREDYADEHGRIIVPMGGLVITAGIDVHKNRLEITWGAYGRNEEWWGLAHNAIMGEVQDQAVWRELERELRREFDHETGAKIGLSMALVDAGKWPEWVYWFLGHLSRSGSPVRGKVRAVRGAAKFPHPLIDRRYVTLAKQLKGHWMGVDEAKDLIYTRLRLEACCAAYR